MTEQQPYVVIGHHEGFELRRYPAHVVAEVTVGGSMGSAGNRAFRTLFGYISGKNASQESIEMTSPVVQEAASSEKIAMTAPVIQSETGDGEQAVAFVLPESMTEDSAPRPTDPSVRIRAVPERTSAAIRYSGRWTESGYRRRLAELQAAVSAAGLELEGSPRSARFDPPFTPWFLRHNEVVNDVLAPS